jgi:HEAT repeat protein
MPRLPLARLAALGSILTLLAMAPARARADYAEEQHKADLKLFEDAKLPHADADLLAFLRKRLVPEKERERLEALIKKLSSTSYKEREQARVEVEKEGPQALPLLRKVMTSSAELEVKQRAERCVKAIEEKSPSTLVMAAARLLKHRRTPGACALLLEYVAVAPDENVEEEVFAAIYSLALAGAKLSVVPPAVKNGKLDPVMVLALTDKEPARRAIAAVVVGRYGDEKERKAVAKMLTDDSPAVRFRAAQGLATARDKSGLAVLVELLHNGPMNLALQAEDLLSLIAQEKGPSAPLGETAELRQKCHAAWHEWWKKNKDNVDLAKVELDAPFGGLVARASAGAIQFINALFKFDPVVIAKVTDVPFSIGGQLNFNTRQEFDAFVERFKSRPPPKDLKFTIRKVISGAEYIKGAPEAERNFLEASRVAQVHVVYLELREGGGNQRGEMLPLFMRISGGRARCIGAGNPRGM